MAGRPPLREPREPSYPTKGTREGTHPIASTPTNRNPKKALFFPPFLPLLLMNRPLPQCGG